MNTRLLSIIKSEQERRNAPAVIAMNKKTGRESPYEKTGLGKLWIVLRGVKDAFNMLSRLSSLERKQILLPGKGHKHVEVEEELSAAGLTIRRFPKSGPKPNHSGRSYRFCYWFLAVLLLAPLCLKPCIHSSILKFFSFTWLYANGCRKWIRLVPGLS